MWRAVRSVCSSLDWSPAAAGAAFLHGLGRKDGDGMRLFLQSMWLAAAARRRGVSHFHAHFATSATAAAMMAHNLTGIPFSFTAHAKDIYHEERDQALLAEALEKAAFAVTVTDHNVGRLAEISPATRWKLRRVYNGVPLDLLAPAPEPQGAPPRLVSVGRLVEKKGFPYLIEACALLRDRGRVFHCSIIGGGPMEAQLRALIAARGLADCVSLEGARPQEAVIDAIRGSLVMVLPCLVGEDGNRDALPTVLLEAMAMARPVVSTDLEGVTEIVDHGETGLLVPQRNSAALAEAIEALIASQRMRAACGRKARNKAERLFDLRRNTGAIAELFRAAARGELSRCA